MKLVPRALSLIRLFEKQKAKSRVVLLLHYILAYSDISCSGREQSTILSWSNCEKVGREAPFDTTFPEAAQTRTMPSASNFKLFQLKGKNVCNSGASEEWTGGRRRYNNTAVNTKMPDRSQSATQSEQSWTHNTGALNETPSESASRFTGSVALAVVPLKLPRDWLRSRCWH